MNEANRKIRVGSRASSLARWQAEAVRERLRHRWPGWTIETTTITTEGDRVLDRALPEIGGKGLFTEEIERALLRSDIDLAVHSLKDLPTDEVEGLTLGATPLREDPRDVLVSREGLTMDDLPSGAIVGTSSPRRQAQLLLLRQDLQVKAIRGNVETRIEKVLDGRYDAVVLAAAGLLRLGLQDRIAAWFSLDQMLPAPGQGALAVQRRTDDERVEDLLKPIEDGGIRRSVEAERAFLARLESGCSAPVGAWAEENGEEIHLKVIVANPDGSAPIRLEGKESDPLSLGRRLAEDALRQGADEIVDGR